MGMREILFRGKRVDNGEWVEGDFCRPCNIVFEAIGYDEVLGQKDVPVINDYAVLPETVGQYTGLADKNGKKIFEGDIVDCWSEGVNAQGAVQQRRDGLWFIYPSRQKDIMWGLCPDEYSNTTVEVIGNIHDAPELLEVQSNG